MFLQPRQVAFGIARICIVALPAIATFALDGIPASRGIASEVDVTLPASSLSLHSPTGEKHALGSRQTIKVEVALVTVPVIVTGKQGSFVPDLKQSDFRIFENGTPQVIDRLIPDADPFNIALMIDSSGSTHFKFGEMQDAALEFIDSLRPQDRVLVVSFGNEVHFGSDFTEDRARLRRSIHETRSEGGQTHLYDALEQVIKERLDPIAERKAIVLFTDGVDNESRQAGSADTLATIEKSDIIVYAIQYDTRKDGVPDRFQVPLPPGYPSFNMLYHDAVRYLRALTGHSGGRLYHAESTVSLKNAFVQIAEELRRQYTLCYYPANQKRDGSFRRIRVTVRQSGVIVRARTGYRAGK
jgi:Ca-activated chloride channel family protein